MATHTLAIRTHAASPLLGGAAVSSYNQNLTITGDTDAGVAVRTAEGTKYIRGQGSVGTANVYFFFEDDSVIPVDASISSISFTITHRTTVSRTADLFDGDIALFANIDTGGVFVTETTDEYAHFEPGGSLLPLTRARLFADSEIDASEGFLRLDLSPAFADCNYDIDYLVMNVTYDATVSNPQIRAYNGYTDRVFASIPNAA